MANASIALNAFTGGEWSNRLHGRTDIEKYNTGCAVLENMVVYPHGGATRRMGSEYIDDAKADNVRLIDFEYNREQAYVLEFSANTIRFYRNGGQILGPGGSSALEVATTYTDSQIHQLSFTQSADILYLVHSGHHPKELKRTGPDTFQLVDSAFTGKPAEWTAGNYPSSICFYQNRLFYAGVPSKPQTIWGSKSSTYGNFTIGTGDSDAISLTLSSDQVNAIQWLLPSKKLLVGTTGGEWSVGDGSILTPSTVSAIRESKFGSKSGRVQLIENGAVYTSRDGKKIREMSYSYQEDAFVSPELSLLSEHLTRPGIKEFGHAQNPDGVLWCVLNNGGFCGFTYLKAEQVRAWHRHSTQGEIVSLCTIEGDSHTEVWIAVKRNGKTLIERMPKMFEGEKSNDIACCYLDSHMTYSGEAVSVLHGLNHLEGMIVNAMVDGTEVRDLTVADGTVDLKVKGSNIVIGLSYKWRLIPLRLEGGSPSGISQGKMKRVSELTVRVERTSGLNHRIPGKEAGMPLSARTFGVKTDSPIDLYTGDLDIKLQNNWDKDGQFELYGDSPFPVTILMIVAKVTVNE